MTEDCKELEDQLEEAREEIEKLKETIRRIEQLSTQGNDNALARMNAGNVPMRAYEYCFGQSSAFLEILKLLDIKPSTRRKKSRVRLFGSFKRILK